MAKGQDREGPPPISLRDVTVGSSELQSDGTYQIGFSAVVYWGSRPAWADISWRPRLNGQTVPGTDFQLVSESRIEYKFQKLTGEKASLTIDLEYGEWKRTVPIRTIDLPKRKRKLEVLGTVRRTKGLEILLQRFGKDGKPEAGDVALWDYELVRGRPEWKYICWPIGPEGINLERPYLEGRRKVKFFLPDDKGTQLEVEVPAKPVGGKTEKAEEVIQAAAQRIGSAFQRGQSVGKSIVARWGGR